ncbi:hypothetical protein QTH90_20890 [Variovorax sp. J2P1-59]|uniref:hypothetical protein n=1 Tax=Variovorax flavidus TaxID=3053501 RepID=UPI00257888D6|nr:hypothetical protein [Variovorax sp. J2P1-59]MDM0076878.1 hypothetical protein [Variovorax sp. J2P1-59]
MTTHPRTTQRTGRIVMQEISDVAASTAALTERCAAPSRDATVKYAPAAHEAMRLADPALLDAATQARAWARGTAPQVHRRLEGAMSSTCPPGRLR